MLLYFASHPDPVQGVHRAMSIATGERISQRKTSSRLLQSVLQIDEDVDTKVPEAGTEEDPGAEEVGGVTVTALLRVVCHGGVMMENQNRFRSHGKTKEEYKEDFCRIYKELGYEDQDKIPFRVLSQHPFMLDLIENSIRYKLIIRRNCGRFSESRSSGCLLGVLCPVSPLEVGRRTAAQEEQGCLLCGLQASRGVVCRASLTQLDTSASVICTSVLLTGQLTHCTRRQLEDELSSGEICLFSWPVSKAPATQTQAPEESRPQPVASLTPQSPSQGYFSRITDLQHKLYTGQSPPRLLPWRQSTPASSGPGQPIKCHSADWRQGPSPVGTWLCGSPEPATLFPPLLSTWMQRDARSRPFRSY
ncbi:SPEF2 protein, partial [Atractosteus spatula]|nr:SPEF2 protein [Atractosteus spatula]